MADTQEKEEPEQQQLEQQISQGAELNVNAPRQSADAVGISAAEATHDDTVAPAEPDASPVEQATNIEEAQGQAPWPDLELDAHHTGCEAPEDASPEPSAAGEPPSSAEPDTRDEVSTSQGKDRNGFDEDLGDVDLHLQANSEAIDKDKSVESPAEATVILQSQAQSPDEQATTTPPPELPQPSILPAADMDKSAPDPLEPTPTPQDPPDTISASPGDTGGEAVVPPSATTAAPRSTRPIRGTLAKPNRGFRGVFVTRNGRKISPEELVHSVERLSKADLFGVDMNELLAMYANSPKTKPTVGKAYISPEEMESMVERLYTSKPNNGITYKSRPQPMKAIFYIENGAHLSRLEPIPPKPAQERTEFMCSLYERCKEAKVKSQNALAEKYLQPLCKPKLYSGTDGKAKIAEIAQKLFAGESTK